MILAALAMVIIMACVAEVASQFSEPGGAYLYVRTAFGRFLGMQIGWLELLSVTTGLGALTSLFVNYLVTFLPRPLDNWERIALIAIVIAIPALANYRGVGNGARLSNLTTLAKLSPLASSRVRETRFPTRGSSVADVRIAICRAESESASVVVGA